MIPKQTPLAAEGCSSTRPALGGIAGLEIARSNRNMRVPMIVSSKIFAVLLIALLFAYPLATVLTHGYDFRLWPDTVLTPDVWFTRVIDSWGYVIVVVYSQMFGFSSPAFSHGGGWEALGIFASVIIFIYFSLTSSALTARRDPRGTLGDARFATRRERKHMRIGLELGLDQDTGRPIRVAVRSNLVSIAPPGAGKTSGLVAPNLAAPEPEAWFGPAIVIDPKGETYRATADRRRALGRKVRCLDPFGLVEGTDTFNPLQGLDPANITYMQRVAYSLLPPFVSGESVYFQTRAADAIVAAILAAHGCGTLEPLAVSRLLSNKDVFRDALEGLTSEPANKMRALFAADPRTCDPILSTAMQAFQWVDDPRMQRLTARSSFELTDLCEGNADLFLTLPTADLTILAPFIRWMLVEIFTTIRRNHPKERLIIFIDEAFALGKFREILIASSELPGANASLWTFWQDRSQIIATYGEPGAKILMNTAEITTVSDPAMVDPKEREYWSETIGDYTLLEESRTTEAATHGKPARTTVSVAPQKVRLMPSEGLGRLESASLLVFPNSQDYAKRPLILTKTRHDDPRLRGLVKDIGGRVAAGKK